MEKRVYELKISEKLENALPKLRDAETKLLRDNILTYGCLNPLIVFHGTIVDGHNRYRICREYEIPFAITEMEFDDEDAAAMWIITEQLGRRNVAAYAKCELVIPLKEKLRQEAKQRTLAGVKLGNDLRESFPGGSGETRDILASMANVSNRTMNKAIWLYENADEETKEKLRNGEIAIHTAYMLLTGKNDEKKEVAQPDYQPPQHSFLIPKDPIPRREPLFPGYGLVSLPPETKKEDCVPLPNSVYDIPPIKNFANSPVDDLDFREKAEMANAVAELTACTNHYARRVTEILRGMAVASGSKENMEQLSAIVTNAYEYIMKMMKNGGKENESEA